MGKPAMTIDERMDRWEIRQEAVITSLNGMLDILTVTQDSIHELMGWLQTPATGPNETADGLRQMAAAIEGMARVISDLPGMLSKR